MGRRTDRLGSRLHPRCLIGALGLSEQCSIVLQARGDIGMPGPQGLFPDRQRVLVERLDLCVAAFEVSEIERSVMWDCDPL